MFSNSKIKIITFMLINNYLNFTSHTDNLFITIMAFENEFVNN